MKINKIKYKFSIFFILLSFAIILFDNVTNFLIYFFVVILHEFAHYFIAKKLGYKLKNFYIMPYGACLNYENNIFIGNDETIIALSGPLLNFFLCILCVALWWIFPLTYYYLDYFCFCNLLLGGFNILPCFPMDGGRVLLNLLSKKYSREKAIKLCIIINYIICCTLIVCFLTSMFSQPNFSFMFIAIFLFSGTINPNKYTNYQYLSLSINREKITKKGVGVKIFAINSNIPFYKIIAKFTKYKFNIVYFILSNGSVKVLSEININNLCLKYNPSLSLDDILKATT